MRGRRRGLSLSSFRDVSLLCWGMASDEVTDTMVRTFIGYILATRPIESRGLDNLRAEGDNRWAQLPGDLDLDISPKLYKLSLDP